MRKIINYTPLVRNAGSSQHRRHHLHHHQHRHETQTEANQPEKDLKYYEYLLKYTYPPLSYSCISTENINNIAAYTARDLLRRLDNKEKENRLNYDLVHKFSKVRILLLYISSRYERESFFRRVNYILYNINNQFGDYKYMELYEEGVLSKLVEICRDNQLINPLAANYGICRYLVRVLQSGEEYFQLLGKICDELEIDWSKQERQRYTRDVRIEEPYDKKVLPIKLFNCMNKVYECHPKYNTFQPQPYKITFDNNYHEKALAHIKQNREEYKPMIEREVRFFENTKITNIDLLTSIEFILSSGEYHKDILQLFCQFLEGHRENRCTSERTENVLFESMLIVRILAIIRPSVENISLPIIRRKLKKLNLNEMYSTYLQIYANTLENLSYEQLRRVLSYHLKVLQRFLITEFLDQTTLHKFKSLYFDLFSKILDYENNGILLAEESNELNFILQAILSIYSKEDELKVLSLMQKYERIMMLKPSLRDDKAVFRYKAVFFICLKYGFKSDIIAALMVDEIEFNLYADEYKIAIPPQKRQMILTTYDRVINFFLYLNVIETETPLSRTVERKWQKEFERLSLRQIMRTVLPTKQRDMNNRKNLQRFQNKRDYLDNQHISHINPILMIMATILENDPNSTLFSLVHQKFEEYCQNSKFLSCIQSFISYPNVYLHLITIIDKLNLESLSSSSELMKILAKVESHKHSGSKIKIKENVYYQEYNNYLENFPVYIDDPYNYYNVFNFAQMLARNPHVKVFNPIKQAKKQVFTPTLQQVQLTYEAILRSENQHRKRGPISTLPALRYFTEDVETLRLVLPKEPAREVPQESTSADIQKNWEAILDQIVATQIEQLLSTKEQQSQPKKFFKSISKIEIRESKVVDDQVPFLKRMAQKRPPKPTKLSKHKQKNQLAVNSILSTLKSIQNRLTELTRLRSQFYQPESKLAVVQEQPTVENIMRSTNMLGKSKRRANKKSRTAIIQ